MIRSMVSPLAVSPMAPAHAVLPPRTRGPDARPAAVADPFGVPVVRSARPRGAVIPQRPGVARCGAPAWVRTSAMPLRVFDDGSTDVPSPLPGETGRVVVVGAGIAGL